eukprot:scaffold1902_cov80-Skeletonema_marinoi.AAC.4
MSLPLPSAVSSNQQQLMDNAAATKTKKKRAAAKEKRKKAPAEVIPPVSFRATPLLKLRGRDVILRVHIPMLPSRPEYLWLHLSRTHVCK